MGYHVWETIDCVGHTSRGECKNKLGPDNPRYNSGLCGQCKGVARGAATAARQQGLVEREQLLAAVKSDVLPAMTSLSEVTTSLVAAGEPPADAVRLVASETLSSFAPWTVGAHDTHRSRLPEGVENRQQVGRDFAVAVHAVEPFDGEHCEAHGAALSAILGNNGKAIEDTPDANYRADVLRGFLDVARRHGPMHPSTLAGVLHILSCDVEEYKVQMNELPVRWLLEEFADAWRSGRHNPDTVGRDDMVTIAKAALYHCSDQQAVDEVVAAADGYSQAEVTAGRPGLFDTPDGGTHPTVPVPPTWTASHDAGTGYEGDIEAEQEMDASARHLLTTGQEIRRLLIEKSYHSDDWLNPLAVGKWLTLSHPPQAMLNLGAWHPQHAATVARHLHATPWQSRVADLTVTLTSRDHSTSTAVQCSKFIPEDTSASSAPDWVQCQNTTTNPQYDGWCGKCTGWLLPVQRGPNTEEPLQRRVYDRSIYDQLDGRYWPAVPQMPKPDGLDMDPNTNSDAVTFVAAERMRTTSVPYLEALAAGADSTDGGWVQALNDRGPTMPLHGATFRRHVYDLRDAADENVGGTVNNVRFLPPNRDDRDVGDVNRLFDSDTRTNSAALLRDGLYFDGNRLIFERVNDDGYALWTDHTFDPGVDDDRWHRWFDRGRRTVWLPPDEVLASAEYHRTAEQSLQVWGGGWDGRPAGYDRWPTADMDDRRAKWEINSEPIVPAVENPSEQAQTMAHPQTLVERGLLDRVTGHVAAPNGAPPRGGVAVFDRALMQQAIKFRGDEGVPDRERTVMFSSVTDRDDGFSPAALTLNGSTPGVRIDPLVGVTSPLVPPGSPSTEPRPPTNSQARPVTVPLQAVRAACYAAAELETDVVAVAWDDGLRTDSDPARPPTVHFDCDPRSELSRRGLTVRGSAQPLTGLRWEQHAPVPPEMNPDEDDPLDLRLYPVPPEEYRWSAATFGPARV